MAIDCPDDLAELLMLWWRAQKGAWRAGLGYPSECPSTRGYVAHSRWDADNGVDDAQIDAMLARAVDEAMGRLSAEQTAAITMLARSLCTGASVWHSPRIPVGEAGESICRQAIDVMRTALRLTEFAQL